MSLKVLDAVAVLLALIDKAQVLGQAINAARAAGREDLTDEEVDSFSRADDEARARLESALQR